MYLFLEGEVPEGARLTDSVDFTSLPKSVYVVVWGENGKLDRNGLKLMMRFCPRIFKNK